MSFYEIPNFVPVIGEQVCERCVMDSTDPSIKFDANGVCSYCLHFDNIKGVIPTGDGTSELNLMATEIKKHKTKDSRYDCIVGFSGGLDSSYLLHLCVHVMKLNPLVLHVDAGWNTKQATANIRCMIEGLHLDLHTIVIDWDIMREIQRSFIEAGIPHLDIPQDMAFFSALYDYAVKNKVRAVLTGANFSTEVIREPEAWGAYPGNDPKLLRSIVQQFSNVDVKGFPQVNSFTSRIVYRWFYGMKIFKPLNKVFYTKSQAEKTLTNMYDWQPFTHKHHESFFTRFLESYYLPMKHKIDRRKAHYSSLILMGQMQRNDALEKLKTCAISHLDCRRDFEFLADKLEISNSTLMEILTDTPKTVDEYANSRKLMQIAARLQNLISQEKRLYK